MQRPSLPLLPIAAFLVVALAVAAAQAQPATTPSQLLQALPDAPTTPEQAAQWLDRQDKVIHPGYLAVKQAMDAHTQAMNRIGSGNAAEARTQAGYQVEAVAQGMSSVGIDMQRMQSDPAYAAQVQQRLQRMTPAEQMALAQRMAAPMQQDRRITNEAKSMADDSPAATAAFEAGQQFAQAQAFNERRAREIKLWQDTEAAVAQVNARKLNAGVPKPAMEYDNIGCLAACQGQWETYAARMLPLMVARETEVLKLRVAALQKQRAWVATELKPVDRHMTATGFGEKATSRVHREQILAYDISAVGEVQAVSERLLDTVRRAAIVVRCGKQAVLVPGAACT